MDKIEFSKVIANKLYSSYPKYIIDNINLVSVDKDKSMPIGTYSYAYTLYPSDYDIFENVKYGKDIDGIVNYFEKSIKKIVHEVSQRKYYWIMEVKVGIDERYNFKIDDLNAYTRIRNLFDNKLLSMGDIIILMDDDYELSNDLLRKYSILRWKVQEILNGTKTLPGGYIITLNDAIRAKSQINLEIIALINNKFTDLSNFYVLTYTDKLDKMHSVNLPQRSITDFNDFFIENLKENIKKLYYSKYNHDYYKLIKRYWSFGKFTKDDILIKKILPIINSPIALAGQKKSEIATLIKLVKHTNLINVPIDIFNNQLSDIKVSLSAVVEIDLLVLSDINHNIDLITSTKLCHNNIIQLLEIIKEQLVRFISKKSLKFLTKVGLAPPPDKYIN